MVSFMSTFIFHIQAQSFIFHTRSCIHSTSVQLVFSRVQSWDLLAQPFLHHPSCWVKGFDLNIASSSWSHPPKMVHTAPKNIDLWTPISCARYLSSIAQHGYFYSTQQSLSTLVSPKTCTHGTLIIFIANFHVHFIFIKFISLIISFSLNSSHSSL